MMRTLRPLNAPCQQFSWQLSSRQRIPAFDLRSAAASINRQALYRTFISNPLSNTQKITACRTIDYPVRPVYDIITDVENYSSFIPYCQTSKVTKTSSAVSGTNETYPEEAELVIGFNSNLSEAFWSRIYCVPHEVIETVAGPETDTALGADRIRHHSQRPSIGQDPTRSGSILKHLRATWTLQPLPEKSPAPSRSLTLDKADQQSTSDTAVREQTRVRLEIEYQFANPVYGALSQAAAPKVAEKVIEAFERRVQVVMSGSGS